MTTPTMPAQYYSRFDEAQNYDEHLFIAGRGLQSAELNEIQKQGASRLKGVADALFKDGDIIRDAAVVVDADTGVVQCQSGAIYLRGAVRGVAPATLTVPVVGVFAIGILLTESVVTALEDPALRDPATGTRNYNEPGAERLLVTPEWAVGDNSDADFYPVYSITNGVLDAKEPPPNLDAVTQALARYDRDSAGGTYVVSGLAVKALPDVGDDQVYSLSEGRCRVYGYPFEFSTARRVTLAAVPDLKLISNEPHLSAGEAAQRINFDRTPGTGITELSITAEKTVTLTHGVFTGAQDPLPDTSVLQILEVKQGGTTYTATTDYLLTAGKVDWTPAGAEPAPGSTYTVKYQYITLATPTLVDDDGFTVEGAVAGTLVLVTYSQKLPRIDRLCVSSSGAPVWLSGVAAAFNPQPPAVPEDLLVLASVYQTWTASRRVVNDGVRVVPMPQLASIDNRLDWLAQLIAQNRLESSIHTRESGTKKGLFTDPFLDDSQRDAGTEQTAAIVRGELMLPIAASISQMGADVTEKTTCAYSNAVLLEQTLRTGDMKINPYMSFAPVPAQVTLTPAVDRWTVVESTWESPSTSRFVVGSGDQSSVSSSTRNALLSSSTSDIETLRPIEVAFSVSGFGPGEALWTIYFDGAEIEPVQPSLVADSNGNLSGTFMVPEGVPSGSKNVAVLGEGGMYGDTIYSGQGSLERQTWQQQTTVTETRWQSPPPPPPAPPSPPAAVVDRVASGNDVPPQWAIDAARLGLMVAGGSDPLAQTFTVPFNRQITGVDVWFTVVPTSTTRVQIRATTAGFPNQNIVAEKILAAEDFAAIGTHTRVLFDAPALLLGDVEYAIVVLCDDADGAVAVAELGKFDAVAQRWITSQPYTVGVLLSSSNASTWTAHQDRDMAFRVLGASYSETGKTVPLGNVAVTGATDLLLMGYADRHDSSSSVEYRLTLPDASVLTVDDGQPIQLAAPITGDIAVSAVLGGTATFSPILYPGTQLVAGVVASTGTYVSRAVPGGGSVTVKTIFEAVIPSGASVTVEYKPVGTGTWIALPQTGTRNVDDGFVEFIHDDDAISAVDGVQIRLTLAGTTAARPRVRDLRVIVL